MGYGVIGNTADSDSVIPGSSPGTPANFESKLLSLMRVASQMDQRYRWGMNNQRPDVRALRRSRFHDEKGNRINIGGMIYAPAALISAALRVGFDYRGRRPMISYRAARVIEAALTPESRCVEFGSGISTPWLAQRCGFLLSLENDQQWHEVVHQKLSGAAFAHVRYEFRTPESFADLSEIEDQSLDFIMIDGWDRYGCVQSALSKIKPGGMIYLDNSDKDMTRPDGDLRRAEAALLDGVAQRSGAVRYFTDFAPTNFFAEQGMMAWL